MIAQKSSGLVDSVDGVAGKILFGGTGAWGAIPRPAQTLSPGEAGALACRIVEGAK